MRSHLKCEKPPAWFSLGARTVGELQRQERSSFRFIDARPDVVARERWFADVLAVVMLMGLYECTLIRDNCYEPLALDPIPSSVYFYGSAIIQSFRLLT